MIKIVTDSVSDIPPQVVEELGITVVPLIVSFGSEYFRDGVDLTSDQFYERLQTSNVFPTTSVPPPLSFAEAYDRLADETDEIMVITVTSTLSGTHEKALQGKTLMKKECRVEVVDSRAEIMAEGFVVMRAARAANAGASHQEVMEAIERTIPRVDILGAFDTLEYLRRGGRIGAAKVLLGSMLNVNPLISVRDGQVIAAGKTRSRSRAIDRLYEFVEGYSHVEELAVERAACAEEAEALIHRLGKLFPEERIHRCKISPVVGAHTGPGLLFVSILGDKA